MIGHQFKVNKNFFYNSKDENNKIIGRTKIKENTIITVLESEIRNGIRLTKLDHSIGWIGCNNKIWNKLDFCGIQPTVDTSNDFDMEEHEL